MPLYTRTLAHFTTTLLVCALAASSAHALERVAVLEFASETPKGIDPTILEGLTDETRRAAVDVLPRSKWLVITREAQEAVMRDNGIDMAKVCTAECEVDLARTVGATLLVTGSVKKIGSSFHLILKVFHAEQGQVLKITKVSAKSPEELYDLAYDEAVKTMKAAVPDAQPAAAATKDAYLGRAPAPAATAPPTTAPAARPSQPAPVVAAIPPAVAATPYAGLDLDELDARSMRRHGGGALVTEVHRGGPAERAGIEVDDIVLAIDGRDVADVDDAIDKLRARKPGDLLRVDIARDGDERTVRLTMGSKGGGGPIAPGPTSTTGSYVSSASAGRPYIGASISDAGSGLRVDEVTPFSPSHFAGLVVGDVIVTVDGAPTRGEDAFIERIGRSSPGQRLALAVRRGARSGVTMVTLVVGERGGRALLPTLHVPVQRPAKLRGLEVTQEMTLQSAGSRTTTTTFVRVSALADGSAFREDTLQGDLNVTLLFTADGSYVWVDHRTREYWAIPLGSANRVGELRGLGIVTENGVRTVDANFFTPTGHSTTRGGREVLEFSRKSRYEENGFTTSVTAKFYVPSSNGSLVEPWIEMQQARVQDVGGKKYRALWDSYRALGFVPVESNADVVTKGKGLVSTATSQAKFSALFEETVDASAFLPPSDYAKVSPPAWAVKN